MTRLPSPVVLAAAAALASPVAARAAGPLEVVSTVLVESKVRAGDGTTRVALTPAKRVVPGDRVVLTLAYRNTGTQPLSNIAFDNPVPAGLAYRSPAPGSAAPEVSVDGRTYGALATLRVPAAGGGWRAASPDDVTHVRWRLDRPLSAGAKGQFAFQAVLK